VYPSGPHYDGLVTSETTAAPLGATVPGAAPGATAVDAPNVGAADVGAAEVGAAEVGAAEVGAAAGDDGELRCPFGGGPAAAPGSRPRPKRGYLLPGTIALFVCAAIAVVIDLAGLQTHTPHVLAGQDVEQYLQENLQTTSSPPAVHCPADEPLRTGLTFTCIVTPTGGTARAVRITEISDNGSFRIDGTAAGA
jgi:hypothetical protein